MKQAIPLSLIRKANKADQFSTLRVWIALKSLYHNSVIYNFSYRKLESLTGISHASIHTHVKIMTENGWAKIEHGHLHLTGINKLKSHKKETCVLVPVEKNKAAQILQLRKVILHGNIINQQKAISKKSKIVNKCKQTFGKVSKSELKLIRKHGGIKKLERSLQNVTTLSNRSIGKLFGLSQLSGHRIQRKLREQNLIVTKTRLVLFKSNSTKFDYDYMNSEEGGYIRNTNGKMFLRLSNEIRMQTVL